LRPGKGSLGAPGLGTAVLDPRNPDALFVSDGRLSDDGGKTWTSGPSLDSTSQIVMSPDGWFAATSHGVVRLQFVHQSVNLTSRWQVVVADLDRPGAVSVAPDGSILVGDWGRVRRLAPEGQVLQEWKGSLKTGVDGLAQDDQERIWVADRSAQVRVLNPDGSDSIVVDLAPPFSSQYTGSVALDGTGKVYLTQRPDTLPRDNPSKAVVVASTDDGSLLAQWGMPGKDPGEFSAITWGVAIDADGNLYIADAGNDRIQKVTSDGTPLATLDALHAPAGIALDSAGNLYVADSNADRIVELAPDGTQLGSWGTWGSGLGQLWQPLGVAVDQSTGAIYVADTLNNRLVRIDRDTAPGP
jgi:sugar lactone lactonase YvrE